MRRFLPCQRHPQGGTRALTDSMEVNAGLQDAHDSAARHAQLPVVAGMEVLRSCPCRCALHHISRSVCSAMTRQSSSSRPRVHRHCLGEQQLCLHADMHLPLRCSTFNPLPWNPSRASAGEPGASAAALALEERLQFFNVGFLLRAICRLFIQVRSK